MRLIEQFTQGLMYQYNYYRSCKLSKLSYLFVDIEMPATQFLEHQVLTLSQRQQTERPLTYPDETAGNFRNTAISNSSGTIPKGVLFVSTDATIH